MTDFYSFREPYWPPFDIQRDNILYYVLLQDLQEISLVFYVLTGKKGQEQWWLEVVCMCSIPSQQWRALKM